MTSPNIYFARPDVFRPDYAAIVEMIMAACREHGVWPLFPGDVDITGAAARPRAEPPDRPVAVSLAIFRANMDLLRACDGVIANIEPFRGPSVDPGTAFEIGVAAGLRKPVWGYSRDRLTYAVKVTRGAAGPVGHVPGGLVDAAGLTVENFRLCDNLMVIHALQNGEVLGSVHDAIRAAAGGCHAAQALAEATPV